MVKEIRLSKGLTQSALADKIGITKCFLSEIEDNKKRGSLKTTQLIADALNVDISKLYVKEEIQVIERKRYVPLVAGYKHDNIFADKNKLQILEVNNADKYAAQFKKIEIKTFADAVKAKRLQLKLTDAKFAELIGINTGLLYQIKNSTDNLNITTLNKFVDALGIEILNYSDYYKFIYNQKENFNILLQSFSKKELMEITGKSRNTIKRWITGENIIIRQDYIKIISLYNKRTGK